MAQPKTHGQGLSVIIAMPGHAMKGPVGSPGGAGGDQCPECGADCPMGANYCPTCGAGMEGAQEDRAEGGMEETPKFGRGTKPPLGGGQRFKALSSALAGKGVRDPDALAASIGRKKYGAKRFGQLSAGGR